MLYFSCLNRQLYIVNYIITCRYCQVIHAEGGNMNDSDDRIFAKRLREAREKLRGMTQTQLSEKSGLPSTSISHFENVEGTRKPSFDNLRRLAKALEVTTDFLLGRTDEPTGGSVNEELYRNVQLLTDADKQFAQDMIKKMIERNQEKDKK